MNIREYNRGTDTEDLLRFYNEQVKYAPFSVPLNESLLHNHVLKAEEKWEAFFRVAERDGEIAGIVHFAWDAQNKNKGYILLLMGASTQICMALLAEAEEAFIRLGITDIQCFPWKPNPYKYLLYGAETYCWAGLYSANNAFRHMGYDVTLDIVVMSLSRKNWLEKELPVSPLIVEEKILADNALTLQGELLVYAENEANGAENTIAGVRKQRPIGQSGYYHLKPLSKHLGKEFGQIDIWINEEAHGQNVGKYLMETMHRRLFSAGVETVLLATNQGLFRAIKFYEGLGYRTENVRGFWYSKYL